MLGELKLVLKIVFESLPPYEPLFIQFTQYDQEDHVCFGMRKEPDFSSQFRYAKLIETISNVNFMLLMMHLLMLLSK